MDYTRYHQHIDIKLIRITDSVNTFLISCVYADVEDISNPCVFVATMSAPLNLGLAGLSPLNPP